MSYADHITLSCGEKLQYMDANPKHFLDKNGILYGPSGSGKTTIIKYIIYILKDYIPNIFICSGTNKSSGIYDGIVPPRHIRNNANVKFIEDFYKRQEYLTEIYKLVHNYEKLLPIFQKVASSRDKQAAKLIIRSSQYHKNDATLMEKEILDESCKENLVKLFRLVISKRRPTLKASSFVGLEWSMIDNIDINPRTMMIIDDCSSDVKKWGKSEILGKVLYEGRNNLCTTLMAFHDDTNLVPMYRKNAMFLIYAGSSCLPAYFSKTNNGIDTKFKKKALEANAIVFNNGDESEKSKIKVHKPILPFTKLIFIRDAATPLMMFLAKTLPKFRTCCIPAWEYNKALPNREQNMLLQNKLLAKYIGPE
jgi:energy-coupling factor transporter ATP-binding protein EcfA2